jgi:CBS domain-containing protein
MQSVVAFDLRHIKAARQRSATLWQLVLAYDTNRWGPVMQVSDIMSTPAITVCASAPLSEALPLMLQHRVSGLLVTDSIGQLVGVLSEGDLLRRIELGTEFGKEPWWTRLFTAQSPAEVYRRAYGRKVSDLMTRHIVSVETTDTLADAARMMQNFKVKRLPVLQDGRLAGVLCRSDFVKALNEYLTRTPGDGSVSDDDVAERIRTEIARQKWSTNCGVRVAAISGRVKLTGVVATEDQREAAVVAAENVIGVLAVEDEIEVMSCVPVYGM